MATRHSFSWWRKRCYDGLVIALCASIPFIQFFDRWPFVSYIMALLGLVWLLDGRWSVKAKSLARQPVIILFGSIYGLYAIGVLYTSDLVNARVEMVLKLPLLLLPLIFGTAPVSRAVFRWGLTGFVFTTILITAYCFITVVAEGITDPKELTYTFLADVVNLHPSIFAMYVGFAALALGHLYFTGSKRSSLLLSLVVLAWLWLGVNMILLASRAGLGMLVLLGITMIITLIRTKHLALAMAVPALIVSVMLVWPSLFSYTFVRVAAAFGYHESSSTQPESVALHEALWHEAATQIARHPMVGVGTGDVEDVLFEAMKADRMTFAKQDRHAHNQFLQTTMALGIIGGLVLIASIMVPAIISVRRRRWIYSVFLMSFVIFMMFDCPLELQSGLIFYATFNALLFLAPEGRTSRQGAIKAIHADGVILHYTDTVMGLACRAMSETAIKRLMGIKQRGEDKSVIVLCSDRAMLERHVNIPPNAEALLALSATIPITIIYNGAKGLPLAGDGSVAIRIPASRLLRGFISEVGEPLASSSANTSGQTAPATLADVDPAILRSVDFVDDEPIHDSKYAGQASTIVKLEDRVFTLLRKGAGTDEVMKLQGSRV